MCSSDLGPSAFLAVGVDCNAGEFAGHLGKHLLYHHSGVVIRISLAGMTQKRGGFGLPDLPTASEVFPDMWFEGWHGALGPGGMPRDVVARMNREFDVVMKSADISKIFTGQGFNMVGGAPEVFTERLRIDLQK